MRTIILSAAVALLAAAGSASAEPLRLTGEQMDQVTAGSRLALGVYKNVAVRKVKNLNVRARLNSKTNIKGNLAEAEAAAHADGKNTFTETLTLAEVKQGRSSSSFSESLAAASPGGRGHHKPKPPYHHPCGCK